MKPIVQLARRTSLLLTAILFAVALPAAAAPQRSGCPRIPSVSSDPLNRNYKAGDLVPAELLDPPFAWVECATPSLPAGATRSGQGRVVFLSVTVDETGAVTDARPRGAIDPEGFYDAAVAAIRSWRTNQPKWRGASVKASIAVDVRFARSEPPAAEPPATQAQVPSALPTTPAATPAAMATTLAQPVTPPPTTTPTQTAPPPTTALATTAAPAPAATRTEAPAPALRPVPTPARVESQAQASAPAPVVAEPPPASPRSEARREPPVTQPSQARDGEPFAVEYYYKVRWGFAEEFWLLFNRNHWPLLQKQMEMGRILEVRAASPRYHATEDGRWDYRVTIVFRNAAEANAPFDTTALERQLFPDLDGYCREEKRRFELLLAHWDVPIVLATLEP